MSKLFSELNNAAAAGAPSISNAERLRRWPSLIKTCDPAYPMAGDGREGRLLEYVRNHPMLDSARGQPQKIIQIIDDFAGEEEFVYNLGEHKGALFRQIIAHARPKTMVELGGYLGYSAILAADEMSRHVEARTELRLYSLEIDPSYATIASELISLAGVEDIVEVVSVDVLLLDHPEELYLPDFRLCESLQLLHRDSVIVADNVVRPGAPEYREHMRSQTGLSSIGVRGLLMPGEFEDELEVTVVVKGSRTAAVAPTTAVDEDK